MIEKTAPSILHKAGYTTAAVYLCCAALTVAICYIDLQLPRGIAIGSLYIVVVLFAIWSPDSRLILITALITSLLVLIVFIYKPADETIWKSVFNRSLALITIWITAVLGLKMKASEQELIRIASHDFLTGLLNRREMFNRLHTEICRVDRIEKSLSVIMIDIDHFKGINDRYGHVTGDKVLKEVSRILKGHLREYDFICRYGGEEFLVAAPETSLEVARDLAERLRTTIMDARISPPALPAIPLTISAGVTQFVKEEPVEATLSRADTALYQAKNAGRNRVAVL